MSGARWSCAVMASLVGGCASTPLHFYTLVPESSRESAAGSASEYRLRVNSVRIPAQVDRLELVVRLPNGGVAITDSDRWIAPLADELQSALSIELLRRLDGTAPASGGRQNLVVVWLNVERFDAVPNRYALIEASWRLALQKIGGEIEISCWTRAYESLIGGYPEIVRGYQHDVAIIADQMAATALEFADGRATECPGG